MVFVAAMRSLSTAGSKKGSTLLATEATIRDGGIARCKNVVRAIERVVEICTTSLAPGAASAESKDALAMAIEAFTAAAEEFQSHRLAKTNRSETDGASKENAGADTTGAAEVATVVPGVVQTTALAEEMVLAATTNTAAGTNATGNVFTLQQRQDRLKPLYQVTDCSLSVLHLFRAQLESFLIQLSQFHGGNRGVASDHNWEGLTWPAIGVGVGEMTWSPPSKHIKLNVYGPVNTRPVVRSVPLTTGFGMEWFPRDVACTDVLNYWPVWAVPYVKKEKEKKGV